MGEEETSITSDINLDNVVPVSCRLLKLLCVFSSLSYHLLQLKTPDVAGTAGE